LVVLILGKGFTYGESSKPKRDTTLLPLTGNLSLTVSVINMETLKKQTNKQKGYKTLSKK
jgi:hypothetical protein